VEEGYRLMAKWLFKSEPNTWSWQDQVSKGPLGEEWGGVRNYLARNNMRAMSLGDQGFFYHSNIGKEVVGIVEVCALSHPDSTADDPRWDCVDIRAVRPLLRPVSLSAVKSDPRLANMALVKCMRLSVQPVSEEEWRIVCELGGVQP